MSRNHKDKVSGHRNTEVNLGDTRNGCVVWGENGKRYAKRLRSKLARRHTRVSLRDLDVIESYDTREETYGSDDYDDYDDYDGSDDYNDADYLDHYDYDYLDAEYHLDDYYPQRCHHCGRML